MPVKIDHKDPPLCDAVHLTKNLNHLLVNKMMRKQRTDNVIKLRVGKRQFQSIPTNRADLIKTTRLFVDRLGGTLVQLESNSTQSSPSLPGPLRGYTQQLT